MNAQLGDGDAVQRRIQLTVAHPGEAMAFVAGRNDRIERVAAADRRRDVAA